MLSSSACSTSAFSAMSSAPHVASIFLEFLSEGANGSFSSVTSWPNLSKRREALALFTIRASEVYGWSIQETGEPDEGARFVIMIPKTNSMGKQNYRTR